MAGEELFTFIAESFIIYAAKYCFTHVKLLPCAFHLPQDDIRVSFSTLLHIRDGSEYLLVRNPHRREAFGPLGGVVKSKSSASTTLHALDFRPQEIDDDMRNDIRGFLPRKNVARLVAWYNRKIDRERPDECLTRELKEELGEAGLPLELPNVLLFQPVRTIAEGPYYVDGENYSQYRIFEIYELDSSRETFRDVEKIIIDAARQDVRTARSKFETASNLMFATADEMKRGRSKSGALIGHHACYLFGTKRIRPDSPMFNTRDQVT